MLIDTCVWLDMAKYPMQVQLLAVVGVGKRITSIFLTSSLVAPTT